MDVSLVQQFTLQIAVMVILQTVFVTHHLSIEFVDEFVNGSIQIFVRAFGKQVAAFDMNIALRALSAFFFFLLFHCQQHTHINHLVKVSQDAIEFVGDIASQCRRDFKMVTADG